MRKETVGLYTFCVGITALAIIFIMMFIPQPPLFDSPPSGTVPDWADPNWFRSASAFESNPMLAFIILFLIIAMIIILIKFHPIFSAKDDPPQRIEEDEMTDSIAQQSAFNAFVVVVPLIYFGAFIMNTANSFFRWDAWDISLTLIIIASSLAVVFFISQHLAKKRMLRDE